MQVFPPKGGSPPLFLKRLATLSLLLCVVACAQTSPKSAPTSSASLPTDVAQRVQQQVRAYFNIPPDVVISVGALSPSEFANYDVVPVSMSRDGKVQQADFLISRDGKTLIRFSKIDLTKDIYAETMSKITLANRPVRGNPDAKVTVVNFDDFECPFCARMHTTLMTEVLPQYSDKIKIVYKDYPLVQIHPWAQHAAIDANCLAKESAPAYWQLADFLHSNQRAINGSQQNLPSSIAELDRVTLDFGKKNGADMDRLQACIKAQSETVVKASIAEGDNLGVSATPTVFVNGERLEGALDADEVRAALNRQLLAAGVQPPPAPAVAKAPAKPAASSPSAAPVPVSPPTTGSNAPATTPSQLTPSK